MRIRRISDVVSSLSIVVGVLLLAATCGFAQDLAYRAQGPPAPPAVVVVGDQPSAPPGGSSGLIVFRDPDTGEIVTPTAEQRADFFAAKATAVNPFGGTYLKTVWPDGHIQIEVLDGFVDLAIVRVDPSGRPSFHCTGSANTAARLLTEPVEPPPKESRQPAAASK